MVFPDNSPQYLNELETLRVSSELFLKNLGENDVLAIISERALEISHADYCEIFVRSPHNKTFTSNIRVTKDGYIPPQSDQIAQQLAMQAIQKQQTIYIMQGDQKTGQLQSWFIFPFKVLGNVFGTLCLGHQLPDAFSDHTRKLIAVFADQAAIAISNTQLFEELTRAYNKLSQGLGEILESRNTLQTLFESITDGLYIIDINFNVVMINQAEVDRLQLPRIEIMAQNFMALGWETIAPELGDLIEKTFDKGQKAHWIPNTSVDDPLIKNREIKLYPILSPQGDVQQVIIFAQDMIEQRQLHASLFQSANLAAVGQLATSVAHEINNPLTIALTNLQLLQMEFGPGHEVNEMIEDIYNANNRIKAIVANLVELANHEIYNFDELDLIETIEESLVLVAHPLRKADVSIQREYAYQPTIIASRSHLKLVWMNLLLNAGEAVAATNKHGTVTITVDLSSPDLTNVVISDTGIGISAKHRGSVFRPFFTTKRDSSKSVGLGLYTTYAIIERHNGQITFNSEAGKTEFIVTLCNDGPPTTY